MATKRSVGDLKEADLQGKKVFVRVDLNVPLDDNSNITDDTRVRAAVPTIQYLISHGARVILSSHLGRPKGVTPKYSLKPLVPRLSELIGIKVEMANDCIGEEVEKMVAAIPNGGVLLLENVRFYKEEEKNDPEFAKKLASLADLYVNDAFGTAHRAHASTEGVTKFLRPSVAGFLMQKLLEGMGVLLTEEEQQKCEENISLEKKRLLAVHEAGHILLAHLFPRFDWHAFSQLLPGGKETAVSVFYPREDMIDQGYTTFGYMQMQMVVAHGGRCAERLVFGDDITDGGTDDLEKITKIAREMVISPRNTKLGLTKLIKRIGLMDRPDNPDGELITYKWDDPRVMPADMTVEVSELFTRELTRYIDETEAHAMKGLEQNKHILDMIAKELLEKSRITGLEVEEKMKGMSPVMFEDFVKPYQINLDEEGPLPHNNKVRYQAPVVYPAPLHRC
ncbi:hypothetical protein MKX01_011462 [Papaver californicum]|nr:hypothetical protein MKX01_011462 [Papaver californicum]